MRTKKTVNLLAALVVLGLAVWGYLFHGDVLLPFDRKRSDLMFKIRGAEPVDPRIVIVDIDEKSLAEMGQWPWPRWKMARILRRLTRARAAIIGLDVVYSEPDGSSPGRLFKAYGIARRAPDYDADLAEAIAHSPTLVGYLFDFESDRSNTEALPDIPYLFIERGKPPGKEFLLEARGITLNIPPIQKAAYSGGFFNTLPDSDGIVRSVPLTVRYQSMLFPALSFEIVRALRQSRRVVIDYSPTGVTAVELGPERVPTDRFGRLLINYRGPKRSYPYVSAVDVFEGRAPAALFDGKIVLIGASAAGLMDLRPTPFDNAFPGIEIHATVVDNLLNRDFLSVPDWIEAFDIGVMAAVTAAMLLLFTYASPLVSGFFSLLLLAGFYLFAYRMLFGEHILINTLFPSLLIVTLLALFSVSSYFFEYRVKELLRRKFSKKVSPQVVDELLRHPSETFETRQKEVTIFFSDIRHFTAIAEKLGDPKTIVEMLNGYMTPMADIIIASQGTIDKYIGDAIMAYWNAPGDIPHHADRAVRAALAQLRRLEEVNRTFRAKGWPQLAIGIGIHTGTVIVGEMGSKGRSDYTITGDNVNLASRLEGLNKHYGTRLLVSEATRNRLAGSYTLREIDTVRVKGRRHPIRLFEILAKGAPDPALAEELARHAKALALYRDGDFEAAHRLFVELETAHPCRLYEVFLARTREYMRRPPERFDGIYSFREKL